AMGLICLILYKIDIGLEWRRFIIATFIIAASITTVYDDLARADITYSGGYLALIMLIAIALPFRPWQMFALCAAIGGAFVLSVLYLPAISGLNEVHLSIQILILLSLTVLACTGISALLYRSRFQQYRIRRKAEEMKEQVIESEHKYRSLFNNSTDAIFIIDNATSRFIMVNPMMEKLLGIAATQLYGMKFHEIIDPDDLDMVIKYHSARLKGEAAPSQYTFKVRSRLWPEPRICDLKIYSSEEDAGITVGAVRDITDRVLAEQKIRDYAAEMKAKNRELSETQAQLVHSAKLASLGNLVAGVAHELNNPLGAIISNASIVAGALNTGRSIIDKDDSSAAHVSDEKFVRILKTLDELNSATLAASKRINNVVTALRNFARLDEAKVKTVNLHDGIESALTILPQESKKHIRIIREFDRLPQITCYPDQLNQVFMNLLINAVEAIDAEGSITVSTHCEDDWVVIRFSDTGRGIKDEHRDKIFDPGFTTKGSGVGTGLGLSISYRIIENHKGSIEVSSEAAGGTSVTVRLPNR
ncbi:MAG: PAS domain S-box protein, partial [Candidatus Zixiibacteriota bacterium]